MPVPAQHPLENQPPSSGNHSNAVVLNPRDLSEIRQLEIGLRMENEKKVAAQIASAKKSLIYNLFMSTIASFVLPSPGNFYFVAFMRTRTMSESSHRSGKLARLLRVNSVSVQPETTNFAHFEFAALLWLTNDCCLSRFH